MPMLATIDIIAFILFWLHVHVHVPHVCEVHVHMYCTTHVMLHTCTCSGTSANNFGIYMSGGFQRLKLVIIKCNRPDSRKRKEQRR